MRVTPRLVEVLSRGPALCCDLALEIAESGPQFNFVSSSRDSAVLQNCLTAGNCIKLYFT